MTHPLASDLPMAGTLRENIAAMAERRRTETEQAPISDRIADRITRFVGSMRFVVLHLVIYGLWILVNLVDLGIPRFDPTFVILASEASVEAIFLSTFVLISQNRMAALENRRADLDLHVNLLAEHELTRLAVLVEKIASKLDVATSDPDFEEIKQDVAPAAVLDALSAHEEESSGR